VYVIGVFGDRLPAQAGLMVGQRPLIMWYVYIIKSLKSNWYYVGSTNSLERRVNEHNNKKVSSTKAYIPVKLVWSRDFQVEKEARAYEKLLKDRRIEKEQIIRSLV
jgi:putative endonuclease